MPRDLSELAKESHIEALPSLSKSTANDNAYDESMSAGDESGMIGELPERNSKLDELHPYTQTLTTSDLESCVLLENAAFPPNERASREKFHYRLKTCGELSLGVFTSQETSEVVTAETAAPVYSGAPERKAVLLGHILSTMSANPDMAVPSSDNPDPNIGHKHEGRTICIHSIAVLPEFQRRGLGSTLLKAYLQRMDSHGVADRVALIAHDHLIPYFERFGFVNQGESKAQFGGGGWYDMVLEFEYDNH